MAAVLTKPRARITQQDGATFIRFAEKPAAEVRTALKQQGAQFIRHRGAWMLPLSPAGAR